MPGNHRSDERMGVRTLTNTTILPRKKEAQQHHVYFNREVPCKRHGSLNYRQLHGLPKSLFLSATKKHESSELQAICDGNSSKNGGFSFLKLWQAHNPDKSRKDNFRDNLLIHGVWRIVDLVCRCCRWVRLQVVSQSRAAICGGV